MGQTAPLQRSLLDLGPPPGIALQGGGRLSDGDDPVGDAGAGDGVIKGFLHPAAQQLDAVGGVLQLLGAVGGFHGQEQPAHLDVGQTQLTQQAQVSHCAGGGKVEAVPKALDQGLLLRPGVDGPDALQTQLGAHLPSQSTRLFRLSSRVTWRDGTRIFRGMPGKPAPVPTSMRVLS